MAEHTAVVAAVRAPTANRQTPDPRHHQERTEPAWGTIRGERVPFSVLAHELRGPMAGLVASTEAILEDFEILDRARIRKIVAAAHRRAVFLQSFVENLLYADTLGHPQLISVLEVLAEVRIVVEPLLVERQQRLRIRCSERVPDLFADGRRIAQALINLILNASKFSPIGTPISVLVRSQDGFVQVWILDQGPGIPDGDAGRLFVPGYRFRGDASASRGGLGLGLSVVRSVVEGHGGSVGADNRPGGGARFWLKLPVEPATAWKL
jgi:signal transduction histidine kinase